MIFARRMVCRPGPRMLGVRGEPGDVPGEVATGMSPPEVLAVAPDGCMPPSAPVRSGPLAPLLRSGGFGGWPGADAAHGWPEHGWPERATICRGRAGHP